MPLHRSFRTIFSLLFLASINPGIVQAQVVPDGSMRTFVEKLQNMRKITGGEIRGNNLFHSFEQLSIPEGIEAIFENSPDIQNIFTRVTGSEISLIEGLLQTQGGANLFLMNPNGIVFGENAQIDIGGSFVATTADRIEFSDGTVFSARVNDKLTVTINAPIGLGLDGNNGSIIVNGSGNQKGFSLPIRPLQFEEKPTGISVSTGKTLALVGNKVNINGGIITADGGNIFLGSVESGAIEINQDNGFLNFADSNVIQYQNIDLNNHSLVDVSGKKVGNITLIGQNINLSNGSLILSQNQGNSSTSSIDLKAVDLINISGNSIDGSKPSSIRSETLSNGKGSSINISTRKIVLSEPSTILANSFSNGSGGDIKIDASDMIELPENKSNFSFTLISASAFDLGDAGSITISTQKLKILDGGTIGSTTFNIGNAGNININSHTLEIAGTKKIITQDQPVQSIINSGTLNKGNAGIVTINTSRLNIREGAAISSSSLSDGNAGAVVINATESIEVNDLNSTFSRQNSISSSVISLQIDREVFDAQTIPKGDSGNIRIKTPILNINNGGTVTVTNQGTGKGGTLIINADNLNLEESGNITAAAESGIGGDIQLNTQNLNISNDSQITTTAGSSENGGNITINTTNLTAKKNSQITSSSSEGDGGNINIDAADSFSLNDQNKVTATSEFGNGGNITIKTEDLQLDNSNISASAGGEGNGGNVNITADTFVAFNDSDVTATATFGKGGNIRIDAAALLGLEEREADPNNGTSDADASSEFGQDGTVTITNPQSDIQDPTFALSEPNFNTFQEPTQNECYDKNFKIVYTGRTGFQGNPDKYSDEIYIPDPSFVPPVEEKEEVEDWGIFSWQKGDPIENANAVRIDENGIVHLVTEATPENAEKLLCQTEAG